MTPKPAVLAPPFLALTLPALTLPALTALTLEACDPPVPNSQPSLSTAPASTPSSLLSSTSSSPPSREQIPKSTSIPKPTIFCGTLFPKLTARRALDCQSYPSQTDNSPRAITHNIPTDMTIAVTADYAASLTMTAACVPWTGPRVFVATNFRISGKASAACGTGCAGSNADGAPSWTIPVEIPAFDAGTFVVSATALGLPSDQCTIQIGKGLVTKLLQPGQVVSANATAPGEMVVTIDCPQGFGIGCYGSQGTRTSEANLSVDVAVDVAP